MLYRPFFRSIPTRRWRSSIPGARAGGNSIPTVPTLNINSELPSDLSSISTHELFTKTGFFFHPRPGLVHWLPIGLMILQKVEAVARSRMLEIKGQEVSLLTLSSKSLWEKTGRWSNTELFKLKDTSGKDEYCLVATCEEEITSLVKQNLKSYKDLPLLYFQVGKKYRDERRPRLGLLRGKEFIMKDAYLFDVSEKDAMETYEKVVRAYYKIFQDLKIPFVKADADTGDIGGSLSHEWHYLHKTAGEDTLFTCDSCGNSSNLEKTLSYPEEVSKGEEVSVEYFVTSDESTLVCAYFPLNRVLELGLLKLNVPDINLNKKEGSNDEDILSGFRDEDALMTKKVIRVMDSRLDHTSKLPDFPVPFVNRSFITTMFDTPIVSAQEGEICGECEDGKLQSHKAIEIGHTFYLGDKYSIPLGLEVETAAGKKPVLMGCYGIGVSRIIAAIGEILRDSKGFKWPAVIAPWHVTVIEAGKSDRMGGTEGAASLLADIQYKLDDRDGVKLGRKVRDSDLIGIPLTMIIGKLYPQVEIEVRGEKFGEEWRKVWDERRQELSWEVIEAEEDKPEKHLVDISHASVVIKALLNDM